METTSTTQAGPLPLALEYASLFRRIVVPVDLSPVSRDAVGLALSIERALHPVDVCVLYVTEFSGNDEFLRGLGDAEGVGELVREGEARLVRYLENLFPDSSQRVTCSAIVDNDLATGIRLGAHRFGATIVFLQERAHSTVFRSRTEKIMQRLDVPVMRLPPRA
jgi:hypothetical protein